MARFLLLLRLAAGECPGSGCFCGDFGSDLSQGFSHRLFNMDQTWSNTDWHWFHIGFKIFFPGRLSKPTQVGTSIKKVAVERLGPGELRGLHCALGVGRWVPPGVVGQTESDSTGKTPQPFLIFHYIFEIIFSEAINLFFSNLDHPNFLRCCLQHGLPIGCGFFFGCRKALAVRNALSLWIQKWKCDSACPATSLVAAWPWLLEVLQLEEVDWNLLSIKTDQQISSKKHKKN